MKLLRFLLSDRITDAIIQEWQHGDKIVAGYVVMACVSTGVLGMIELLKIFL